MVNTMYCLKDVVVCKFASCNQVYNDARILPCGKRTCTTHIDEMIVTSDDGNNNFDRKMLKCFFCQKTHSFPDDSDEFPVDENIPILLNIKYSREHSAAKKCFNEVTQLIDKLAKIDKEGFVIDYFERVEADIVLEKEVNMQKLVSYYQKLVDELHERKLKCLHCLKTSQKDESELDAIKQTLTEHESQLNRENLDFILKTLDGDEDKWKAIQSECSTLFETVRALEREFTKRIISDQKTEFKPSTSVTQVEQICGNLDQRTIDSLIINSYKMENNLVDLCKLSGKEFKLLYRASCDGFLASSFHAKCDMHPRTLTIIKTTNECIFGGYTSATWDGMNVWKADPNAFLFSLVNVRSVPQLMPIKVGDVQSIYCNAEHGPTFGAGISLHVSNNSNTTMDSYSNLGQSYDFTLFSYGTCEAQSFLAGSRNFQVSEIEVFLLN